MQGSSTTISTLTVPTALRDPINVINRPLPLHREIVRAHRKVLPLDSVQAPPSLLLACRAHHPRAPPAAGRARATVLRESRHWHGYSEDDVADLGLSGAILYAESTMSTRTRAPLVRRRAYQYMAALQEENDTHSHQEEEAPYASLPPSAASETPTSFMLRHAVTLAVIRQNYRQKIRPI